MLIHFPSVNEFSKYVLGLFQRLLKSDSLNNIFFRSDNNVFFLHIKHFIQKNPCVCVCKHAYSEASFVVFSSRYLGFFENEQSRSEDLHELISF